MQTADVVSFKDVASISLRII